MPAVSRVGDASTGHDGFPPTDMISSPISKTKINGKKPGVKDSSCQFATHNKGNTTHPANTRYPNQGSKKTKIEGYYLARIGDTLADGDVISAGSDNTFIE
jgi:uncharacterized Zn-binding protein involved in type VI secretion